MVINRYSFLHLEAWLHTCKDEATIIPRKELFRICVDSLNPYSGHRMKTKLIYTAYITILTFRYEILTNCTHFALHFYVRRTWEYCCPILSLMKVHWVLNSLYTRIFKLSHWHSEPWKASTGFFKIPPFHYFSVISPWNILLKIISNQGLIL